MSAHARDLRLFVAAYPPAEVALDMLGALKRLDLAPHRPTPPDQVHLTLAFIGDTPSRNVDHIRESVARAVSGVREFPLTPSHLLTLPRGRGSPRLVALETDAPPPLLELLRRLIPRLVKNPRQRPADRFLPHITLCRFDHTSRARPLDVEAAIPPFQVDHIRLMQSTLRPEGARHDTIESFALA